MAMRRVGGLPPRARGRAAGGGGGAARRAVTALAPAPAPGRRAAPGRPAARATAEGAAGAGAPTTPWEPSGTGDVYSVPEPLPKGAEKHTISIFVADEAGIINRVAGVFARRNANIESLAVGLNVDKALFTVVVTGAEAAVANLVCQIGKLVKVRNVVDVTKFSRVDRELVLIKVATQPGPVRSEVIQLANIFRAKVIDTSERDTTLAISGDPGKTYAFENGLRKFGIKEIARTGKISLQRGVSHLVTEEGDWREGTRRQQRARRRRPADVDAGVEEAAAAPDVYTSSMDEDGVWNVDYMLEGGRSDGPVDEKALRRNTLSILVNDKPGVLGMVTGVFARRGYNIQSLAVGSAEKKGLSRITMVCPGTRDDIEKLQRQLYKLIEVVNIDIITDVPHAARELMLLKIRCFAHERGEVLDVCDIFRANVIDAGPQSLMLEVEGRETKMVAIQKMLQPFGILEIARTGRVAMPRSSGVDTAFLDKQSVQRLF